MSPFKEVTMRPTCLAEFYSSGQKVKESEEAFARQVANTQCAK